MVDRTKRQAAAHRQTGVPCADDDRGRCAAHAGPPGTKGSANLDRDIRRVGNDVVHGRSLLGLGDDRLDLVGGRVGVDVVGHLDAAEPVANVTVDPENAGYVHVAFECRSYRAELDLPVLSDGGDTGGEAACESHQHVLDGRRPIVFGGEYLGMISVEVVHLPVLLLFAETEETLDGRRAVGAIAPGAIGAPLELSGLR